MLLGTSGSWSSVSLEVSVHADGCVRKSHFISTCIGNVVFSFVSNWARSISLSPN